MSHAQMQILVPAPGREALLDVPPPPEEPELPAVGRALISERQFQPADSGIAGTGSIKVRLG